MCFFRLHTEVVFGKRKLYLKVYRKIRRFVFLRVNTSTVYYNRLYIEAKCNVHLARLCVT